MAEARFQSRIGSSEGRVVRALQKKLGADWWGHVYEREREEDEQHLRLEQLRGARRERDEMFERRARQLEESLGGASG
jgi:hypothetical protein